MTNTIEVPSLEEIEQMDVQRQHAIESLEISDGSVKCQRCGIALPLLDTATTPKRKTVRMGILEKRLAWMEEHAAAPPPTTADADGRSTSNRNRSSGYIHLHLFKDEIRSTKQELAEMLQENAEADKLRRLPLYCCRLTLHP